MFNIVPIVLTLTGLAGFIIVVSRRLEILRHARSHATPQKWAAELEERWGKFTPHLVTASGYLEAKSRSIYEKILRSLKILNLRIDTFLTRQLEQLKAQRTVKEERDILRDLVESTSAAAEEEKESGTKK